MKHLFLVSQPLDTLYLPLDTRPMRCVLVGNYGCGNIGDEALKEYFLSAFPEIEWIVISAGIPARKYETGAGLLTRVSEVPRLPFGLRSLFTPWWKTIAAIRSSDAVVFGGGSLFTDTESVLACMQWSMYSFVARICGKRTFLAFQGVGPFHTWFGERISRSVFAKASFVSVRDEESQKRLLQWGIQSAVVTFDPAFVRFAEGTRSEEEGTFTLIPRKNSGPTFIAAFQEKLRSPWKKIVVLLMEPGPEEFRIAKRIESLVQRQVDVIPIRSISELLHSLGQSSFVITERYHGALAALALGLPSIIIPQASGDKLSVLQHDLRSKAEFLALVDTGEAALKQQLRL